jgi:predicted RND superfamily exporter protein/outer membrane lipoprotein-sorting protein
MSKNFVGDKGWSGAFARRFAEGVLRWRHLILVLSVVVVTAGGYGLKRLAMNDDYRVWFSPDSPDLKAFESLETKYSKSDNVLMVIAPKDGNVFTPKTLADIQWLTQKAWKTPFSSRVDSLTNFQKTDAVGDELSVHDLVKSPEKMTGTALQKIRAYALKEPALVKNLVSERGHVAAVNITIAMPGKSPTESSDVAAYVRGLKKELMARDPEVSVHLSGLIMLEVVDSEISARDMQTLIPLMYVILLVGLGLLLRTFLGVLISLLTITFTIAASMGLAGWLGFPITAISAMAPTIIMTLAVSDCVHILVTFYQQMRHGKAKREAMLTAIQCNLYPSALTSIANLVGYASMNFSESPPFRQFGNTVAVGSAAELALAFLFIPALVMLLPVRVRRAAVTEEPARPSALEEGMASFVLRHRYRLLGTLTAITVFFGFFVTRNQCNEEFTKYHAKRVELRQDNDFIAANLTGVMDLAYSLDARGAGGIYRPDFLKDVESFTQWYRSQPEVESVTSISDVVKRINRSMNGDAPNAYRIPRDRKLLAQYLLLYEMSLPYGMDLTSYFNIDKSATRLIVRVKKLTTNELIALNKRAQEWARTNTQLYAQGANSYSASVSLLFAQINYRMIGGMVRGFLLSFVLISGLLMLLFRSIKIGFLSLVPNLFPAVIAFGIWGIFDGMIGMAVATVCTTTLGVVVDSTIHLFYHYLAGRRELKLAPEQAVHHAFGRAGTAIMVTDTILVIGFGVLVLSPFEINWVMGELTAMTIFFDIFVTLFLTVPFVLLFDRDRGGPRASLIDKLLDEVSAMTQWIRVPFRKTGIRSWMIVLMGGAVLLTPRSALTQEDARRKGLEIAARAKQAEAGYHDYSAEIKMILKDATGAAAAPDLLRVSFLETPGDGDKGLATFEAPGDVRGTSLLTFTHKNSADDQWLFLPEVKRVKRISATNKSGPFMGSEFAYEDMCYQAVERYHYRFVKQEKCALGSCFVVERIPVDPESGYSRQQIWWDTRDLRAVRVEYFDRKGSPLKVLEASDFRKFLGHWWRPMHMVMTNQQNGKSTVIDWSQVHFHVGLAARDFDTNSLQRVR